MLFREHGIPGETLHAKQHMPEPSAELRAAFQINSSSFYVQETTHRTAAGVIHVLLEKESEG